MRILLEGLRKFSAEVYPRQEVLFHELSQGQQPHTLMITCSDSRIDPNLVTQSSPGEIFYVRNAGNIVPPYGSSKGGEEAAIEYAIEALKVKFIVICGHTNCGAMQALMKPEAIENLPSVKRWLDHAESTKRRCCEHYKAHGYTKEIPEDNVLVQVDNLMTHPAVSVAVKRGQIQIFGWMYHMDTGTVTIYDPHVKRYVTSKEVFQQIESNVNGLTRFSLAGGPSTADYRILSMNVASGMDTSGPL